MATKKTEETKEVIEKLENNDCFIIMPIADHPDYKQGHFKRVYEDIFAPACRAAGYRPIRADDVAQTNLIHLDILQKLLESPMAICDLSTRNPNVLFELGLRQAFDKPTILVQEVGTPQIFDINLFRYTQYRNGLDYRDVLADQNSIQKVLEETKIAVQEKRSVNSIIKLLSITNPASLQDSSNFGDKEYFQILMSEIQGLKNSIALNNSVTKSNFIIDANSKYIIDAENDKNFIDSRLRVRVRVSVDNEMPQETVQILISFIEILATKPTFRMMEGSELSNFVSFYCDAEEVDIIIQKIRNFAKSNNIEIGNIRKNFLAKIR